MRRADRPWPPLLTPVVVLLAVASIGATAENVVADRIESTYPAPGKTYDVGDHRLHLNCEGTGGPTVVLFNGMGEFSASWAGSPTRSAPPPGSAPTTAPARAGGDDAASPQDGVTAARDLHAVLTAAGEHGPYVWSGTPSAAPTP